MSKENKKSFSRKGILLAAILLFMIAAGCAGLLGQYYWQTYINMQETEKLARQVISLAGMQLQEASEELGVDHPQTSPRKEDDTREYTGTEVLAYLQEQNPDAVGFLSVKGTNIAHPVVQGEDNDWYLNHTFLGEKNRHGALFLDVAVDLNEQEPFAYVVYGHHMKDGTMFHDLEEYREEDFLSQNQEITFLNPQGQWQRYEIEQVFFWQDGVEQIPYLEEMNQCLEEGRNCLVLITCTYNRKNERLAVLGKEVMDGE